MFEDLNCCLYRSYWHVSVYPCGLAFFFLLLHVSNGFTPVCNDITHYPMAANKNKIIGSIRIRPFDWLWDSSKQQRVAAIPVAAKVPKPNAWITRTHAHIRWTSGERKRTQKKTCKIHRIMSYRPVVWHGMNDIWLFPSF